MRVLQLGKFYPVRGGVEKVMYDLTLGLSERGIPCDMLCATKEVEPGVIQFNPKGRVICVKALAKVAGTMIAPAMISYLRRHKDEYDLVHIHHPDPMAALALWWSGFRGRVILHWHSDIVSQKAFLVLYKPLQNWLIRRADKIVGTTPVYVRESPYLKNAQQKCTFDPIGIRPVLPDPERVAVLRNQFDGGYLALSVGRLIPYKGFSYLIDAISRLPEDWHLVLGGTGPLRETLEKQIAELHLEGRVKLLGYVPDEDLPVWYGACDVFVLPSVMKTEAFGIVQIEAMSCGKPVVATLIPGSGVSWVNSDGVSGFNVPPRDAAALADGILRAYRDAAILGPGAAELFRTRYTLDKMIDKIIHIYENK